MAATGTITGSSVNIRDEANSSSIIIGVLSKGQVVTVLQMVNNFYFLPTYNGYVSREYIQITSGSLNTIVTNSQVTASDATNSATTATTTTAVASLSDLLTTNLNGIHGIPYQFMSTVDRRLDGTDFGRKYAEKIVGRMPLLFLTPGKQTFMSDFNKSDKNTVLSSLADMISGNSNDANIETLINGDGRYYTFEFDYKNYFSYVNPACNATAKLLGIGNEVVEIGGYSSKLSSFDWSRVLNSSFSSYFSSKENVVFYINPSTSISESFSNDTTQSSLVSTINGMSDQAKEIQFLLGAAASTEISALNSDNYDSTLSSINSVIGNFTNGSGVLSNLASGLTTVLSGGKLVFPEIWSDSDHSVSYDIDIKLRSPDHDDLSIYLNTIVPYIHLVAMTAPRELDTNAYSAPFLVRAFYKGSFNIDMGIITSLSSSKGKECGWNDTGLPTEIDVSLTIKDLYSSLFISNNSSIKDLVNNTAYMDYLCNMVGLNLSQPEITRKIAVYSVLSTAKVKQLPNSIWNGLEQDISNLLQKLY